MRKLNRKEFLQTAGLAVAGVALSSATAFAVAPKGAGFKAIAFDGFPIFDPRPIFKAVDELFPEKGKQLSEVWKAKQFGYQWLRATAGRYKDFWEVTMDALDFAVEQCGLTLTGEDRMLLMGKYRSLNVWPDVVPALEALRGQGLQLGFLSNMTAEMLDRGITNSGTGHLFDFLISTDAKKTYKPSPEAYQMGIDILKYKKEEILFVAFAGWDMAGAKWFGYPTYWVNRLGSPMERLDAEPDGVGKDLAGLVEFVRKSGQ